ncbi:MAG: hypothetical protein JW841_05105 [Deltaproteobacteria bacterium]|nr:hypothetical protein [Deltaproteobacteria bacterium]
MSQPSSDKIEIHPLVIEIIDAITFNKKNDLTIIPEKKFITYRSKLKQLKHEITIFEHLVVIYTRLLKSDLETVANQFLELAKIGLVSANLNNVIDDTQAQQLINIKEPITPPQTLGLKKPDKVLSDIFKIKQKK